MIIQGFNVPDGIVIPWIILKNPTLLKQHESIILDSIQAFNAETFIVRSSATIEDSVDHPCAGLFESMFCTQDTLFKTIQAVYQSKDTQTVHEYQKAHNIKTIDLSIIIQSKITGMKGTLYTRCPYAEQSHSLIEWNDDCWAKTTHHGVIVASNVPDSTDTIQASWIQTALNIEACLNYDNVDIEWVLDANNHFWIVQARPVPCMDITHEVPKSSLIFSKQTPLIIWRLDVEHNPDPLSPAQQGLVSHMRQKTDVLLQIVEGYLYYGTDPTVTQSTITSTELKTLHHILQKKFEAIMQQPQQPLSLEQALKAYEEIYHLCINHAAPMVSFFLNKLKHAIKTLTDYPEQAIRNLLSHHHHDRIEYYCAQAQIQSTDNLHHISRFMSPVWDVAQQTYQEQPHIVDRSSREPLSIDTHPYAETTKQQLLKRSAHPKELTTIIEDAQCASQIAELDDFCFYKAQATVRYALQTIAKHWGIDPEDIFYLSLEDIINSQHTMPSINQITTQIHEAKQRLEQQQHYQMPHYIINGESLSHVVEHGTDQWKGRGVGGQIKGIAYRLDHLAHADSIPQGAILVAQSATPAMTFALQRSNGAIITHAGLLSHAAAMARAINIPCIVDCHSAWNSIQTGDTLWIDGQQGIILRL